MDYGRTTDHVIGALSRILHVRPAKHNTVAEFEKHYLDLPIEELFPGPELPQDVRIERSLADRALKTSTVAWRSGHQVICPSYAERHRRDYPSNHTAYGRWIRPLGKPRKACLIYVHGWLEPGSWAEETTLFRKWQRELDVDLLHVALPFHGRRKPRWSLFSGELFWTADLVRSIEGMRQAIYDTRAAIEWLRAQGYEQVGVTGISLGGAITMMLGCLEPTPDYIIPIIAHARLEEAIEEVPILWRVKHDLEKWGVHQAQRYELFRRVGLSAARPKIAPERQLWIQARDDVYMDADVAMEQWKDWDRPPILWIDGGHMTFPLHVGTMTDKIREFRESVSKLDAK